MDAHTLHPSDRIYVAGHRGMVGAAIVRALRARGFDRLVLRTHAELDLRDQAAVQRFFRQTRPDVVFVAAARVGGILANNARPAEFIYDNLMIEANLIRAAFDQGVERLLFLGSSCIYPREAPQPMREEALLSGPLEPTNEPYAVAKIAGIKLCESFNRQYGTDYRSLMPTNLYGPGDNFDERSAHVIPGLVHRFHRAKEQDAAFIDVWGTGRPRREFLYVDDLASACLHVMDLPSERLAQYTEPMCSHLNVGTGTDLTIAELAEKIRSVVGFKGEIRWDTGKPDGTPRKLLDTSRIEALGWRPRIGLDEGLRRTYQWFLDHHQDLRR